MADVPKAAPPIFPYAQVKPGIEATGYTVFEGTSAEAFSATVLGTVEAGAPQRRMIVCRLSGARIERTGILAAMSGSPLYVDGKLLGAVAYAWPFSKEALCGVTPAEDMLEVARRGRTGGDAPPGREPATLQAFFRRISPAFRSDAAPAAARAPGRESGLAELRDAGFAWSVANRAVPSTEAPAPGPGDMIGVQLVSGDVQFTAFGTVTWTEGPRFLAFGHPFLGLGTVELPVTGARVVADVASLQRGFKLASATAPVGVVLQDRPAGVYGQFGERAKTMDAAVEVAAPGAPTARLAFQVIRHPVLTPALLAGALTTAWTSVEDASAPRTVRLRNVVLQTDGGGSVRLKDQAFAGPQAFGAAAEFLSGVVDLLLNNPHAAVPLSSLRLDTDIEPGNRSAQAEAAWLDRDAVRPGDPLALSVRLQPQQAPARIVSLTIPTRDLPAGSAVLWVGNALDVAKKVAATGKGLPHTAAQYEEYLSRLPGDESLAVAVVSQSPGALLQRTRVGDLPPSVASLMARSPGAQAAQPAAAHTLDLLQLPGTGLVEGLLEVPFSVEDPP